MRLKHCDLMAVSDALRDLYSHTDTNALPHCVIRMLRSLIASDSVGYNEIDFPNRRALVIHDAGPEADRYMPMFEAMVNEHPLAQHQHLRGHWRRGAAKISDFVTHRQLRDTGIYREFLHPLRIEDQLGLYVEETGRAAIAIVVQRDGLSFGTRDAQVLTLLQPHLMQAFKNAADLTTARNRSARLERTVNGCALGVVWLSAMLTVDWMSELARRCLDRYFSLQGRGGRSLPDPLLDWVRVQHRLSCVADHVDRQIPLTVEGQDGRLTIRWIREGPQRSYLLLSEEPHAPRTLMTLGLTPREAEVLHWLAEGKSNESIGIILGIASRTAEKHVENILAKLGVENRVEAAMRAREQRMQS